MLRILLMYLIVTVTILSTACSDQDLDSKEVLKASTSQNIEHDKTAKTEETNRGLLDSSECSIEKLFKYHFSSTTRTDNIRIMIQGTPCISGDFDISVFSSNELLYNVKGKISDLYVDTSKVTVGMLSNDLNSLVKEELTGIWPEYSKDMSRDESLEKYGDVYHFSISKERFESYRNSNLPSLAITTYYDEVIHLVFDPEKNVSEIAWSSGL